MSFEKLYSAVNNLKSANLKKEILKNAQQDSFFQQNTKIDEATREKRLRDGHELGQKYNLTPSERTSLNNNAADAVIKQVSLSTRYAPDMPGVQAMRVADGVYQNPYSGKVYDYNQGFKVDNLVYSGGSPSLQTDIMTLASDFKSKGLLKEARLLGLFAEDIIKSKKKIVKSANPANPAGPDEYERPEEASDTNWIGAPPQSRVEKLKFYKRHRGDPHYQKSNCLSGGCPKSKFCVSLYGEGYIRCPGEIWREGKYWHAMSPDGNKDYFDNKSFAEMYAKGERPPTLSNQFWDTWSATPPGLVLTSLIGASAKGHNPNNPSGLELPNIKILQSKEEFLKANREVTPILAEEIATLGPVTGDAYDLKMALDNFMDSVSYFLMGDKKSATNSAEKAATAGGFFLLPSVVEMMSGKGKGKITGFWKKKKKNAHPQDELDITEAVNNANEAVSDASKRLPVRRDDRHLSPAQIDQRNKDVEKTFDELSAKEDRLADLQEEVRRNPKLKPEERKERIEELQKKRDELLLEMGEQNVPAVIKRQKAEVELKAAKGHYSRRYLSDHQLNIRFRRSVQKRQANSPDFNPYEHAELQKQVFARHSADMPADIIEDVRRAGDPRLSQKDRADIVNKIDKRLKETLSKKHEDRLSEAWGSDPYRSKPGWKKHLPYGKRTPEENIEAITDALARQKDREAAIERSIRNLDALRSMDKVNPEIKDSAFAQMLQNQPEYDAGMFAAKGTAEKRYYESVNEFLNHDFKSTKKSLRNKRSRNFEEIQPTGPDEVGSSRNWRSPEVVGDIGKSKAIKDHAQAIIRDIKSGKYKSRGYNATALHITLPNGHLGSITVKREPYTTMLGKKKYRYKQVVTDKATGEEVFSKYIYREPAK